MIDLEPMKKCLRFSPTLYRNAYTLYRAMPFARRRIAKIDHEVSEQLRVRLEYESRLIKGYLNDDWTVRHGPFAGMKYAPLTSGSLLSPKVIGSYESPIHQWITDAINQNYETILNVGCGEGYYAVGFSLKSKASHVYAYDIDKQARDNVAVLAQLNGTADRVHIRDLCTKEGLQREITNSTLIFCDIEGGEFDLFRPDLTPGLSRADLIIETHDYCSPGVTETLMRRFLPSHRIDITYHCAKYANEFPVLEAIPIKEHAFLLEEGRPHTQGWMRLLANRPGAIQPGPGQWWLCEGNEGF
jgi:ribosomal protein L11 methyltransferase PrmA